MFTDYQGTNGPIGYYNEDISRIARYVRSIQPD
jgi:hypothetical protein